MGGTTADHACAVLLYSALQAKKRPSVQLGAETGTLHLGILAIQATTTVILLQKDLDHQGEGNKRGIKVWKVAAMTQ